MRPSLQTLVQNTAQSLLAVSFVIAALCCTVFAKLDPKAI